MKVFVRPALLKVLDVSLDNKGSPGTAKVDVPDDVLSRYNLAADEFETVQSILKVYYNEG